MAQATITVTDTTPYLNVHRPGLVTGQSLAATFPGTHITSTPPVPQQHQTYQDQMQALQFSSHPRPNYVTTAYSTESATPSPPASYTGSSGAPQAVWEPTPFVPPARPASSTGLPSPSAGAGAAGHSPDTSTATAVSSTTDTAGLQTNVTRDPQDRGTPSPSFPPPSVPHSTRPGQEAGTASSPHALLARSQNPQYVDDYHLH
ncbi:hypothetical protein EC957_002406 [Mortierella hygrophila]|uniref:Uncharacterized protein n=1 Tax=Mortierella hygrophila TaxID=979708 RepID=A0A9P6K6W5_9FUNG|nr:hypothetical protein EC957_002406 [Mortierella hygrophila]